MLTWCRTSGIHSGSPQRCFIKSRVLQALSLAGNDAELLHSALEVSLFNMIPYLWSGPPLPFAHAQWHMQSAY